MAPEHYPYQYQHLGTIKAYKRMTPQKASALNRELEARGGCGRWVFGDTSAQPERIRELLNAA